MRQHNERMTARYTIVAGVEHAPDRGADGERLEVIARHEQRRSRGRVAAIRHACGDLVRAGERHEGRLPRLLQLGFEGHLSVKAVTNAFHWCWSAPSPCQIVIS